MWHVAFCRTRFCLFNRCRAFRRARNMRWMLYVICCRLCNFGCWCHLGFKVWRLWGHLGGLWGNVGLCGVYLGATLGGLGATLGSLGGYLGQSWAMIMKHEKYTAFWKHCWSMRWPLLLVKPVFFDGFEIASFSRYRKHMNCWNAKIALALRLCSEIALQCQDQCKKVKRCKPEHLIKPV